VRLAGMTRLRNLNVYSTRSNQIFGKDAVYPQLKSFSYSGYSVEHAEQNDLSLLKNVTSLSLSRLQSTLPLDSANTKVSSLELYMKGQEVIIPDKFFERVKLHSCRISQSSSFSKVQILELTDGSSITEIIPFKNVPYLHLQWLPEVKDFSSLGNQRYLMICHCEGPSNEAMKGFGNIFHLYITSCNNVTEIENLRGHKNKILYLGDCLGLRLLELSEQDYIQVNIRSCSNLDDFKIHGTIYSLFFTLNERWTKETIPRKYQYLNGEEKHQEEERVNY
jgi:hypothetical protein